MQGSEGGVRHDGTGPLSPSAHLKVLVKLGLRLDHLCKLLRQGRILLIEREARDHIEEILEFRVRDATLVGENSLDALGQVALQFLAGSDELTEVLNLQAREQTCLTESCVQECSNHPP